MQIKIFLTTILDLILCLPKKSHLKITRKLNRRNPFMWMKTCLQMNNFMQKEEIPGHLPPVVHLHVIFHLLQTMTQVTYH
ncbi:unnamed protein product [Parnassius apollo]|uniref:(apollo) hypothetical protein n=1 Tax=Parnassius apollo TaxID=110799 RepID=A0A8S3WU47_PARAO|nr:unnamed protein product [Parnassius apollo]